MTEQEEYTKECDSKEIHRLKYGRIMQSLKWNTEVGDNIFLTERGVYYTGENLGETHEKIIWLPTLKQLLEILGNKFFALIREKHKEWECRFYTDDTFVWYGALVKGESSRLALIRAVKAI